MLTATPEQKIKAKADAERVLANLRRSVLDAIDRGDCVSFEDECLSDPVDSGNHLIDHRFAGWRFTVQILPG